MNEFKYMTASEIEAMSDAERSAYVDAKQKHDAEIQKQQAEKIKELQKGLDNAIKNMQNFLPADDFKKFKDELENAELKGQIDNVNEKVNSLMQESLKGMGYGAKPTRDFRGVLEEKLEDVKKSVEEGRGGYTKIGYITAKKAPGNMTFANSVIGQIPQADRDSGINYIPRRNFVIRDAAMTGRTDSNLVEWVEQQNREGGAAMTTEGSAKEQVDWEWKVDSKKVRKLAVYTKITTEMLNDISGIMSEINSELLYNIELVEENQLLVGNGTSPNLEGLTNYAQPLNLSSLADIYASGGSNYADCISASLTQIFTKMEGAVDNTRMRIYLHPTDFFAIRRATKATDNQYIKSVDYENGQMYIDGVLVIQSTSINEGFYLAGDMSKFHIRDLSPISFEMGLDGKDFTNNFVTIRAEKRLNCFVKANHTQAFVYESFADATTFLESV